ncbi:MAG: hypothetical protein R6U11_08130 [Bacteroidales bacterium]
MFYFYEDYGVNVLNRKGVISFIVLSVVLTVIFLSVLVVYSIISEFDIGMGDDFSTSANTGLNNMAKGVKFFDFGILLGGLLFSVFVVGKSFGALKNPVWLIFDIIFFIPLIVFSGSIADFFISLEASSFGGFVAEFPFTFQVLQNFPLFIMVLGFLSMGSVYVGGFR